MKRIVKKKQTNRFDIELHPEYYYVDINSYFNNLKQEKYIKKNSYSLIYHSMLKLVGTHNAKIGEQYKHINISYGHIVLLSYIMGFITEASGFGSFFGSNATLANDIGVDSRTIQRWLRNLEDVGFIKTTLEFNTDRRIYVNFGNIIDCINRAVGLEVNDNALDKTCGIVVQAFIQKNYLEQSKFEYYKRYLIKQCNIQLCLKKEINMKYLFSLMIEELDLDWVELEEYFKKINHYYIENVANKNLRGGTSFE